MSFLITFLSILFEILNIAIIARVLTSWMNIRPDHPIVEFLYQITEPILGPLRNLIPPIGMMDISPIVAIILLEIIRNILVSLLRGLA